jgi:hypothetical protein
MNWMQGRADVQLVEKLDNNEYDEASLIEIKVPIDLPYQTDWNDFERFDGEVVVEGIHYKYVKRKVENGFLVLKCIPDINKQQMLSARDYFFQLANDLQHDKGTAGKSSSGKSPLLKMQWSDYEEQNIFQLNAIARGSHNISFVSLSSSATDRNIGSPEQPPEA